MRRRFPAAAILLAAGTVTVVGCAHQEPVTPPSSASPSPSEVRVYVPSSETPAVSPPTPGVPESIPPGFLPTPPTPTPPKPTPTPPKPTATTTVKPSVFVEGDSLTVGAEPALKTALLPATTKMAVDAVEGRGTSEGVTRLTSQGNGYTTWVVALGTNDDNDATAMAAHIDQVMAAANTRQVVWVNVVRPGADSQINAAISGADNRYPNLHVLNWAGLISEHPDMVAGDGIHLTAAGYTLRAEAIAAATQRLSNV